MKKTTQIFRPVIDPSNKLWAYSDALDDFFTLNAKPFLLHIADGWLNAEDYHVNIDLCLDIVIYK